MKQKKAIKDLEKNDLGVEDPVGGELVTKHNNVTNEIYESNEKFWKEIWPGDHVKAVRIQPMEEMSKKNLKSSPWCFAAADFFKISYLCLCKI